MYCKGNCLQWNKGKYFLFQLRTEVNDIEQLLNETINEEISKEDLRLPNNVHPIHYRLKIHPLLDEPTEDNFTFTGQVNILVSYNLLGDKSYYKRYFF